MDLLKGSTTDPNIKHRDYDKFSTLLETPPEINNEENEDSLLRVAGAASHKVFKEIKQKNCQCKELVSAGKGGFTGNEYFDFFQRGGLVLPSELSRKLAFRLTAIFEQIKNDKSLLKHFMMHPRPNNILTKLTLDSIYEDCNLQAECECGTQKYDIAEKLCLSMGNNILDKFTKGLNDSIETKKFEQRGTKRKMDVYPTDLKTAARKFKTLSG